MGAGIIQYTNPPIERDAVDASAATEVYTPAMSYRILAISAVLACVATSKVDATVLRPIEFSALVAKAQAIAHGRVASIRSAYNDDRSMIQSVVTLEVTKYLKGDFGKEITFVVPGGTVGRYRAKVVGAPQFSEGQEVVLFLSARPPAIPRVVGLNQGVFRVEVDRRTGARTIGRVPISSQTSGLQPVVRGSAANQPMSLSAFDGLVRSIVEKAQ
jgi:hypothetical protein